jgi:hypothetical protein
VAAPVLEPVTIATAAVSAGALAAVTAMVGEVFNHYLDDPSPLFDSRTTALFNIVGMTVCTLLFVVPASILDAVLASGQPAVLPGYFGMMAFALSGFLVAVLRGLLINLTMDRREERIMTEYS